MGAVKLTVRLLHWVLDYAALYVATLAEHRPDFLFCHIAWQTSYKEIGLLDVIPAFRESILSLELLHTHRC